MISIWHWHTEPLLIGGILAVVWVYAVLVGPLREWIAPYALFPRKEAWFFGASVVVFYIAVGSPIDALGENYLFSAHMFQHNLLMYTSAPLLIRGIPGWLFDGLLERSPSWIVSLTRFTLHPLVAGFAFTFVFCVWHFPALYEAALHNKAIHALEHLTMFVTSVMMFWPILSPSNIIRRSNPGVRVLYLFVLMVAQIPLFGILTFFPEVLYPTYEFAPRVIPDFGPLQDQVLGGLLMKVANMVVSLVYMGAAFYEWNATQEREMNNRVRASRAALARC